jgi:hypothetical protein
MTSFSLRRLARSRPYVAVAVGAVIALALGGTAFAVAAITVPVSGGNIHACYSARSGALRVLTSSSPRCRSGEHTISWTQSSLGHAYTTRPSTTAITLTTSLKTVATLKVPPGNYLVTFTAEVFATGPNALDWVNCIIRDSRGAVISAGFSTIPFDGSAGFGAENMAANGPTSRGGAITARCFDQASQAAIELISLEATPVNKLAG